MSAPIKQFDRFDTEDYSDQYALYVLHADHLASHAYDEEKERALFEAAYVKEIYSGGLKPPPIFERVGNLQFHGQAKGDYERSDVQICWLMWKACAKSRAKAAGCL
jgi:hypothetical protein